MAARADEIAAEVGTGRTLVDLGAGNCVKAGRLFATLRPRRYVAVDISVEFLRQVTPDRLEARAPRDRSGCCPNSGVATIRPADGGIDGTRDRSVLAQRKRCCARIVFSGATGPHQVCRKMLLELPASARRPDGPARRPDPGSRFHVGWNVASSDRLDADLLR